jgi:hypothetical protein
MGKVWVLDTGTKGTGAEMVPLEKVLKKPAPRSGRDFVVPSAEPASAEPERSEPRQPPTFKVIDVMTRETLAEGASARATVDLLAGLRSVVDVSIYVWEAAKERWRLLPHRDQKLLWSLRETAHRDRSDSNRRA